MRVGGRRNEQVHHSSPRLTAHSHNCGSKQPVAGGHRVIDRQGGDRWNSASRRSRSARTALSEVTNTPKCSSAGTQR